MCGEKSKGNVWPTEHVEHTENEGRRRLILFQLGIEFLSV
jgi:hypothetical protein